MKNQNGSASMILALLAASASMVPSAMAGEPPITSAVFAPDGRSVVAASQAGVIVYSWPELKAETTVDVAVENPHDLSFSPAGRFLAIAGGAPAEDGQVEVVRWPDGPSVSVSLGHADSVMALCWLDRSTLATVGMDHAVMIWEVDRAETIARLDGHSKGVVAVDGLPDHPLLVTAGLDQSLRVWDRGTGELVRSMSIHVKPVNAVAARPPGEGLPVIASASDDGTVRFWQPTIGRMVRFARLPALPRDIDWSPDGSTVFACCDNGKVYAVDPVTVSVSAAIGGIEGWAYTIAVHPTDGSLVVGGENGVLVRLEITRRP